jgi:hypothetical protein
MVGFGFLSFQSFYGIYVRFVIIDIPTKEIWSSYLLCKEVHLLDKGHLEG